MNRAQCLRIFLHVADAQQAYDDWCDLLVAQGLKLPDFTLQLSSFREYMEAVQQRNRETEADGHMVIFTYDAAELNAHYLYFHDCWEQGLSPHKALTFL